MIIHTMSVADDEPGMVDVTFRVPIAEVLGRSLDGVNSVGGLYQWSGWFAEQAKAAEGRE